MLYSSIDTTTKINLVQSVVDPCLFFSAEMKIWTFVYVNDLIIATTSLNAQKLIKDFLSTTFKMKEIGISTIFFWMNSNQQTYINKIILDYAHATHIDKIIVVTPMQGRVNLQRATDEDMFTDKPYQHYLTVCFQFSPNSQTCQQIIIGKLQCESLA